MPLRPLLLPLLLALLLPLLPGRAAAVPVAFERTFTLDWPSPAPRAVRVAVVPAPAAPALVRVRLFTIEITALPSGRLLVRRVVALPARPVAPPPAGGEDLVVLPLPGAMPLFLGALAGLVLVGRRRRGAALARARAPA